jgi:hypothetical protein
MQPEAVTTDDRIFFNWLYGNYNVTSHFEVDGKLYSRQGASWPGRVITIDGRQKSDSVSPREGTIARVDTWGQVYEQYRNALDAQDRGNVGIGKVSVERPVQQPPADDTELAPLAGGNKAGGSDGSRSGRSKGGNGNVERARPGVVDDRGVQLDQGLAGADNAHGRDAIAPEQNRLDGGSDPRTPAATGRPGPGGHSGVSGTDHVVSNDADNQFQVKYVARWRCVTCRDGDYENQVCGVYTAVG